MICVLSKQQNPSLIFASLININTNNDPNAQVIQRTPFIQQSNSTMPKYINFYNNSIQFPIPAIIIAGPPKTGTNTLLKSLSLYQDIVAYPIEHFYFGSSYFDKPHPCSPIMNQTQWIHYLTNYESINNNHIQTKTYLSDLIHIIKETNPRSTTKCTANAFKNTYKNIRKHREMIRRKKYGNMTATEVAKIDSWRAPKSCINPFKWKREQTSVRSDNIMYCWFIEKAPAYARTPYVPIYVANELPKTKYLTILRNPINHVWSNYFHFAGGTSHIWDTDLTNLKRAKDVISKFRNEKITSINIINGICNNITTKYKQIHLEDKKERWLLMREDYKKLIIQYFKGRYNEPKDIFNEKVSRFCKLIWATYYVPILFVGLFVNDEVFIGDNNIDEWDPMKNEILNYRYIQFEWLWHDTLDSIRTLKCWMTQGWRLGNDKCEYERDDVLNEEWFRIINKSSSKGRGKLPEWYKDEIVDIFSPCTNLIVNNLLRDRPNIFLGQWIPWDRFPNN